MGLRHPNSSETDCVLCMILVECRKLWPFSSRISDMYFLEIWFMGEVLSFHISGSIRNEVLHLYRIMGLNMDIKKIVSLVSFFSHITDREVTR